MTVWHPLTCACCLKLEKRKNEMYCVEVINRCDTHSHIEGAQELFAEVAAYQKVMNALRPVEEVEEVDDGL